MNLTNEMPFRIASAILLAMWSGVRWYFQKGLKGDERITVRHERREKFFFYLTMLVWWVPILLYILSPWIDFAHLRMPVWLRWGGGIILFLGDACFFWAHRTLGKNWSGVLEIRKDHTLVTEGPYRFVRHPMYTAFFLIGIGVSFLSANWLIAVSYLGSCAGVYVERVSSEEEMMLEQFGDAYREYMQRTGRLIPRLRL
jgi:protein-S-isoprenylcysteine O-methyltransferase Ste14